MINSNDFNYNGMPIFNVGFNDFNMFVTCLENGNRILTKNIQSPSLQEHYKKSRTNNFGICYEGVIIELDKLKNKTLTERIDKK